MNSTVLLRKLIEIERSIGTASNAAMRGMVQDAEDCLLQMQKETAERFFSEAWREGVSRLEVVRKAS